MTSLWWRTSSVSHFLYLRSLHRKSVNDKVSKVEKVVWRLKYRKDTYWRVFILSWGDVSCLIMTSVRYWNWRYPKTQHISIIYIYGIVHSVDKISKCTLSDIMFVCGPYWRKHINIKWCDQHNHCMTDVWNRSEICIRGVEESIRTLYRC